jgi:hypothetical protein
MIAYKKLIVAEFPTKTIVMSPMYHTVWEERDGLFRLSYESNIDALHPGGIYSCKESNNPQLEHYWGSLVRVEIGGTVIEHEEGFRSTEAAMVEVIERSRNDVYMLIRFSVSGGMLLNRNLAERMGREASEICLRTMISENSVPSPLQGEIIRSVLSVYPTIDLREFQLVFEGNANRPSIVPFQAMRSRCWCGHQHDWKPTESSYVCACGSEYLKDWVLQAL